MLRVLWSFGCYLGLVFNIFDFELSADDMNKIKSMDTDKSLFFSHRDVETVKFLINYKRQ